MNCFECVKMNDTVAAVGICRHCGAGLCLDHLIDARGYEVGATNFGCTHELPPRSKSLSEVAEPHPVGVT